MSKATKTTKLTKVEESPTVREIRGIAGRLNAIGLPGGLPKSVQERRSRLVASLDKFANYLATNTGRLAEQAKRKAKKKRTLQDRIIKLQAQLAKCE